MESKIISKPRKPFVKSVKPLEGWKLHLTFENGEERMLDMKPYMRGIFTRLEEPEYFKRVKVVKGSIAWPHGQDLAYDMLYHASE